MAIDGFERADKKVSVHEGGYINHPKDPGGATNKGVIQRVYDLYRKAKGLPKRSVKNLTEKERVDIYRTRYWDVIKGDELPAGIDYVVYDGAVNSGPSQSVKWLQRALQPEYKGKIDGDIGPETLRALEAISNHDKIVNAICDRRIAFLQALSTFKTFGRGWLNRVRDVREVGLAWANDNEAPTIEYVPDAEVKANLEDAKKAPPAEVGTASAATGIASGGLAGTLNQLQEQLTPYSVAGGWIEQLVVWLIVGGAVLSVGGLAYRWYSAKRTKQLSDALDHNVGTGVSV